MAAPSRSTPQSQLPASQSAPVAEFRCLYTPDIRKKQKKWQDGYLKFHTFNNRVMVYDQARNFLGDTYYKDSNELHEGDELTLDKGVMVEVADTVGVTQTDLTPLFEKKPKEAPPPPSAPPRRFQPPSQVARPSVAPSRNTRTDSQLRHKSLNTLLGTPKGPIGKSVPIKSPYEARQEKEREKENDFPIDRAGKRQKTAHSSTSSATLRLSSPVQEDSPAPKKTLPLWAKTSDARPARKPADTIPQGASVINLDVLDAITHISSDISLPSTPHAIAETSARTAVTPAPPIRPTATDKQAIQTPKIPRGKVPVPSVKALETPQVAAPPSSPPVSASNRLTNVDFAIQPTPANEAVREPPKQRSPSLQVPNAQLPPPQPKAKSLRLSAGVKRGTLMMCQPPPPPRARYASEPRSANAKTETKKAPNTFGHAQSPPYVHGITENLHMEQPAPKRKVAVNEASTIKRAKVKSAPLVDVPDAFDEDQEVFHGLMDQQLIVPPAPPSSPPSAAIVMPDSLHDVPSLLRETKATVRKVRKSPSLRSNDIKSERAASTVTQMSSTGKAEQTRAAEPGILRKSSQPAASLAESPQMQSRAASPALSAVSDSRSRIASISPRKLAVLSTGGFRRKIKRATPQLTTAPDKPAPAPRSETVALPPHPLRANRKGPVMTTTELAATLQRSRKKSKVPLDVSVDPIEDDPQGKSPDRRFRRVRSENDAPIPSTSEDWEKRNLPKTTSATKNLGLEVPAEKHDTPGVIARKKSGLAALVKKTDPRRKFVRTQSLNVDTNISPRPDVESPMVSPVVDEDVGPWSTEAFDLFDWRPPQKVDVEM